MSKPASLPQAAATTAPSLVAEGQTSQGPATARRSNSGTVFEKTVNSPNAPPDRLVTSPVDSIVSSRRTGMPTPYETPVFTPTTRSTVGKPIHAPFQVPCTLRTGTSPTPPGSNSGGSPEGNDCSPVTALPGTMSARRVQRPGNTRRRTREDIRKAHGTEQGTAKFGGRIKATLREMFRKSSTDDDNLERIGDRHWTDE